MFLPSPVSLFVFAISSLAVASATNIIEPQRTKLSFAARVNATGSANIIAADRARAQALRVHALSRVGRNARRPSSFSVTNSAVIYTANVGVGRPATNYTLVIDTGSSNTWVGGNKKYVKTSTSKPTGQSVSVFYGSGFFDGDEYTDTVTLSSALIIKNQSIGVAVDSAGFNGLDGILGIGPVDLTLDTTSSGLEIPTVTDDLHTQGIISTESIGIYYAPATSKSARNGELTFGGIDSSKITSPVKYVPLITTSPASGYWGIKQSVTYGTTFILGPTAGIVDTGTTFILLATEAYNVYKKATGATFDNLTGLLKITPAQYRSLKNLNFVIGGSTHSLTPNAQIWPRVLNSVIGGSSGSIYLIVADIGSNAGEGFDFVNGYTFLERFYSVFDTTNSRVGFAPTIHTPATTN